MELKEWVTVHSQVGRLVLNLKKKGGMLTEFSLLTQNMLKLKLRLFGKFQLTQAGRKLLLWVELDQVGFSLITNACSNS